MDAVCYHCRGVTSARATLFEAKGDFLPESLCTVGTTRILRLVVERQQDDSCGDVVLATVFDPGGSRRDIV